MPDVVERGAHSESEGDVVNNVVDLQAKRDERTFENPNVEESDFADGLARGGQMASLDTDRLLRRLGAGASDSEFTWRAGLVAGKAVVFLGAVLVSPLIVLHLLHAVIARRRRKK